MVSTRADKVKFSDGEKVLCYEPDPSKAKVLYDSKVLQVIHSDKVTRGRKQTEYLIHFQGWNASWDRKVPEEYVLKDIDENRRLQLELAEKSQIKLSIKSNRVLVGAGSHPVSRKRRRRLSETIRETIERERSKQGGSSTSSQIGTTEDEVCSLSSEAESSSQGSTERDIESQEEIFSQFFPLNLPMSLKEVLERDAMLINKKNKLLNLPSQKCILAIFEDYVKFFAIRYISRGKEKRRSEAKDKERALLTLDLCTEVIDGLRVCFDFYVYSLLLYPKEKQQAERLQKIEHLLVKSLTDTTFDKEELMFSKCQDDSKDGINASAGTVEDGTKCDALESSIRRVLRSKRSLSEQFPPTMEKEVKSLHPTISESGRSTPTVTSGSSFHGLLRRGIDNMLFPLNVDCSFQDLTGWTVLPECHRTPPVPIMLYGAVHLLRLFVKLPSIMYHMNLDPDRRRIVLKHSDCFLEYLNLHVNDIFEDANYQNSTDE